MIEPGATFKDNLQQLPPVSGVQRIDLVNADGLVVASIENQPGKQGSVAVYHYLKQAFGTLDTAAAVAQGLIEYIDFPDALRGKYQSYTQADLTALRAAGCDHAFADVATGVGRYMAMLAQA